MAHRVPDGVRGVDAACAAAVSYRSIRCARAAARTQLVHAVEQALARETRRWETRHGRRPAGSRSGCPDPRRRRPPDPARAAREASRDASGGTTTGHDAVLERVLPEDVGERRADDWRGSRTRRAPTARARASCRSRSCRRRAGWLRPALPGWFRMKSGRGRPPRRTASRGTAGRRGPRARWSSGTAPG